MLLHGSRGLDH